MEKKKAENNAPLTSSDAECKCETWTDGASNAQDDLDKGQPVSDADAEIMKENAGG
jgi:hypothetical protein